MKTEKTEEKTVKLYIPQELKEQLQKAIHNFLGFNGEDGTYLYHRKSFKKHVAKVEDFQEIDDEFTKDFMSMVEVFGLQCMLYALNMRVDFREMLKEMPYVSIEEKEDENVSKS